MRILLRAARDPFDPASAGATISQNLIATNTGNLLFSDSAYRMLSTPDAEVVTNGPRLNGDDADPERINDEYDHLVLPLANAFRQDFATRWLPVLTRLVERLRIPVTVLGVGAQTGLDYDLQPLEPIRDQVTAFMRAVMDRGPSVGVRGELTQHYLESLGFHDVEVIGCPSMFLHGRSLSVRPVSEIDADSAIALSVTASAAGIGELVAANLDRYPGLVYFAQELRDLKLMVLGDTTREQGRSPDLPNALAHPLLAPNRSRFHLAPSTWIDDLRGFDASTGTRIHANIAALLAGTPAHVICHDSRTLELSRYFAIPHTRADALAAGADLGEVMARSDFSALTGGHDQRLDRMVDFLAAHGLSTVFADDGDEGAAFDARMSSIDFPPAVTTWTGADDGLLPYRVATLRESGAATDRAVATQTRRLDSSRRDISRMERELATLRAELTATRRDLVSTQKRLAKAEKTLAVPLSRRLRDGVRRRLPF